MSLDSLCQSRCNIQRVTRTSDGRSGFNDSWANLYTSVHCRFNPLSAREIAASGRQREDLSHRWYAPLIQGGTEIAVQAKDRITFDSRTFEITGVRNIDEINRMLTLDLLEIG